jgi:hypothetical protein
MYHFDGNQVMVTIQGIALTEFGEGEFLTITPRNPPFNESEGYSGSAIRSRRPNQLHDGKLVLTRGSPDNEAIMNAVVQDQNLGTGAGPLLIKDLNGTTLITAQISYFLPPEAKMDSDGSPIEWSFVAKIRPEGFFVGSNRFV